MIKLHVQLINNDQPEGVCKFIERVSPRNILVSLIEKVTLLETPITQPLVTFW